MSVTSYTQGHDASTLQSHQARSAEKQADYLLPHIKPTSHILDVGCGPGTITCDFAKYAPQGKVIGVDYSPQVISKAQAEAESRGCGDNISFQVATAHNLPFADDSFDIVHCHAVLVHLPDATAVLREMRRVCKSGGYVAAREPDWDTCVIHPRYPILDRWKEVQHQLKRKEGAEPNAGRRLAEWAVAAGFDVSAVKVSCNVLQYFGKDQVQWWGELSATRMTRELRDRTLQAGLISSEEVEQVVEAYREWSKSEMGIWVMTHMCLLCQI